MATNFKYPIAVQMRTILTAIPGSPGAAGVKIQEDDSVQSRTEIIDHPQWIITMGDEEPFEDTTAGDTTGNGDILKRNYFGVSMYYPYTEDLGDRLSSTPDFVIAAQQALNVKMPTLNVFRSDLMRFSAWERNQFETGVEVTRFLMIYTTSEPRNG